MADVFLSYSREDLDKARSLAAALEKTKLSVWWDRRIPHGKDFTAYIQEQLDSARCIVVLWSRTSVTSQFVRDEATEGLPGRLVPALIEDVKQPLGFRQLQAANLSSWDGRRSEEELDRLIQSINEIVQASRTTPPDDRVSHHVETRNRLVQSPPPTATPAPTVSGPKREQQPTRAFGKVAAASPGTTIHELNVYLAVSSDAKVERAELYKVIASMNETYLSRGVRLKTFTPQPNLGPGAFKDSPMPLHSPPPPEECDIVIGVFWQSGGELAQQIERLCAVAIRVGKPRMMLYFCDRGPLVRLPAALEAFERLREFRDRIGTFGIYSTYKSAQEFSKLVRNHLAAVIDDFVALA